MRKILLIFVLALIPAMHIPTADAGPQTKKMRCEKARKELTSVNRRIKQHPNPEYAGDLLREQALWQKQIDKNCPRGRR